MTAEDSLLLVSVHLLSQIFCSLFQSIVSALLSSLDFQYTVETPPRWDARLELTIRRERSSPSTFVRFDWAFCEEKGHPHGPLAVYHHGKVNLSEAIVPHFLIHAKLRRAGFSLRGCDALVIERPS